MINIIWDDIIFKKNKIAFDIKRLQTILQPVEVKGIIESLNLLKNEYFNRLYSNKLFKLKFVNGQLVKKDSPGWGRLMDGIELVQLHYEIKFQRKKNGAINIHEKLEPDELIEIYEQLLSRTDYLKHLAKLVDQDFRLIPVLEYANGQVEDSFLFRFKNKNGNILLVWENVNLSRATYIFKFPEVKHEEVLKKIEQFICSTNFEHKRSILSGTHLNSRKIKKDLYFYEKYPHADFEKFKSEIEYLINYTV